MRQRLEGECRLGYLYVASPSSPVGQRSVAMSTFELPTASAGELWSTRDCRLTVLWFPDSVFPDCSVSCASHCLLLQHLV